MLDLCEEASGERPIGCPWVAMRDPFVVAVLDAHMDWSHGAISVETLPAAIAKGVKVYDRALNAVRVHDMREDRRLAEEAAKERAKAR